MLTNGKGLGTSTAAEAKEYFSNLPLHLGETASDNIQYILYMQLFDDPYLHYCTVNFQLQENLLDENDKSEGDHVDSLMEMVKHLGREKPQNYQLKDNSHLYTLRHSTKGTPRKGKIGS